VFTTPIVSLLDLQHAYQNRQHLDAELGRLPLEVEKLRIRIRDEELLLEQALQSIRELEVEGRKVALEVQAAEERLIRYKTQQMQVKKTDEFQALAVEISRTQVQIGEGETRQLELMEQVDAAKLKRAELSVEVGKRVDYLKSLILENQKREAELRQSLLESVEAYAVASARMEPGDVARFERLTTQITRPPYVVSMEDHSCVGCHMRVSNDTSKRVKSGALTPCDHCGRILYFKV
jgi:predicted  nucleic acid-binding Zn-ribbon protein